MSEDSQGGSPVRARLLKIVLQPIILIEDGDTIEDHPVQAFTLTARQWHEFKDKAFDEEHLQALALSYVQQRDAATS